MQKNKILDFKLNERQKEAVETIEGPVMVIAGPGTGKTQTLTARIANILQKTDTPADGILALTFTESGVRQMRDRLVNAIGSTGYYVNIQTFHSFCSDVIRENPDVFLISQNGEPLSELERISLFREILDKGDFKTIRPDGAPYLYVSSLVKAISDLKREGVSSEKLEKLLEKDRLPQTAEGGLRNDNFDKYRERNLELLKVYRKYQSLIRERERYDFEDMINLTVEAFKKNPDLLLTYQQRYLYILVDEYQDTNSAQNELLMLLTSYWGEQANIFVVGDDEQSIYRFQGASIENLLAFRERFSESKIITLTRNYRSHQLILNATRSVIDNNKLSLVKELPQIERNLKMDGDKTSMKIEVGRFSSGVTESFFIAKEIRELIDNGAPVSEIAVIFRHNSDGAEIAEMLSRMQIPYDLEGGQDVLVYPDSEKLFLTMRAVLGVRNNQEGIDLFTLLNYPFMECDYLETLKLSRSAAERKINLWEAMAGNSEFEKAYRMLGELQADEAEGPFTVFFEKLINKTGFLDWCLKSEEAVEKLNVLNSLFSEIKRLSAVDSKLNLEKFLGIVDLMKNQKIVVNELDIDARLNAVLLTTAHRAKGREFETVFIYRAADGKWGNNKIRELIKLPEGILTYTDTAKKEKNEDERRLFYVAMTRAKKYLFITSAETYISSWGRNESNESMFVQEIPDKFIERIDISQYESGVKEILTALLTTVERKIPAKDEEVFLQGVLANFRLSSTALNIYLACPYKFKLNNLLRAPRAKSSSMSFGTAIHKALEEFFREYKRTRKMPNAEKLKKSFSVALGREILSEMDRKRLAIRGQKTLGDYFEYYQNEFTAPLDIERFFGYGWSKIFLGAIPLAGKIDRIDSISSHKVRVVDYKTGQPKSRKEIEGETAQSKGDYKRQLVFYRLLGELDQRFTEEIIEAELDFVEKDKRTGKFKKEKFIISEEEVENLKKVIKKTWEEITALKFDRTHEVSKNCVRCEWRFHCWPEGIPVKNEQLTLLLEN